MFPFSNGKCCRIIRIQQTGLHGQARTTKTYRGRYRLKMQIERESDASGGKSLVGKQGDKFTTVMLHRHLRLLFVRCNGTNAGAKVERERAEVYSGSRSRGFGFVSGTVEQSPYSSSGARASRKRVDLPHALTTYIQHPR